MNQDNNSTPTSISYRDAGVDIDAGNTLVERIKPIVKGTFRPGVVTGLGGLELCLNYRWIVISNPS